MDRYRKLKKRISQLKRDISDLNRVIFYYQIFCGLISLLNMLMIYVISSNGIWW